MVFLKGLLIYTMVGIIFNIFAEFQMKNDPEWTNDSRLAIIIFWPLVIYAYTL